MSCCSVILKDGEDDRADSKRHRRYHNDQWHIDPDDVIGGAIAHRMLNVFDVLDDVIDHTIIMQEA